MSENTDRRLFTDEQVMEACGITQENLRKLITWRAVTPVQSGGGRGKVRLWASKQVNRICVTEQFRGAGFSLRMAHTLTYALPLDNLLYLYNIDSVFANEKHRENSLVKRLLYKGSYEVLGDYERKGHVVVINNKHVYTDATGDVPLAVGDLDWDNNCFIAFNDIERVANDKYNREAGFNALDLDVVGIDKSSLLLCGDEASREEARKQSKGRRIIQWPYLYGWSTLVISLYIGLDYTFRRLLELPVD